MAKTNIPVTTEQARIRLEELCARSERSTGELRDKLWQWHITGKDADSIINGLQEARFVDDSRFAAAYTLDKLMFARWGRNKIRQGLMMKRVPLDIITQALKSIDEDAYRQNIEHIIAVKLTSTPALKDSYEGRTRLYRHILSKGYEPQIAVEVLRRLLS